MWKVIRENPRAVVYAVLMHLVLLALLVIGLDWTPKVSPPGHKVPIEAELVTEDPLKKIEERKAEEARRQAEQEQQRKAEEQAAAEAQQKAAAEAKRKAELAAKQKAEARAKAEAKQKAEAEARRRAEAELQAQLAAEQEQQRANDALSEYIPYIQQKVVQNWIRPPGSPQGLVCVVKVRLIPGGEVVGATVIQSSGDPAFDRSVETAVLKASPLPLPSDPSLFNYFREINFKFNPGR